MANVITPMSTNLAASGKKLKLAVTIEFDVGAHNAGQIPIVDLEVAAMSYNQMIPFQIDIVAAQKGVNLWEAPSLSLRARAVIIQCLYGAGGILINPDGDPTPFPLASDGTSPSWLTYINPDGTSLEVDVGGSPVQTGPGIQKITVDTENEARFQGYIFV